MGMGYLGMERYLGRSEVPGQCRSTEGCFVRGQGRRGGGSDPARWGPPCWRGGCGPAAASPGAGGHLCAPGVIPRPATRHTLLMHLWFLWTILMWSEKHWCGTGSASEMLGMPLSGSPTQSSVEGSGLWCLPKVRKMARLLLHDIWNYPRYLPRG